MDVYWVRKSAFAKEPISDAECKVVCNIVNTLRPFVPRRNHRTKPDGTRTSLHPPLVCLRAPIVIISNAILCATGHPEFTSKISPHSSAGAPTALILNASGIYETLCQRKEGCFNVKDRAGNFISAIAHVTTPVENKDAVLGGFLDLGQVKKICSKHDLDFIGR